MNPREDRGNQNNTTELHNLIELSFHITIFIILLIALIGLLMDKFH